MNHFIGLAVLAVAIAIVFALITKEEPKEQLRHFVTLLAYLIVGSLVGAWVMSAIPW